jgi:hypothetical protein
MPPSKDQEQSSSTEELCCCREPRDAPVITDVSDHVRALFLFRLLQLYILLLNDEHIMRHDDLCSYSHCMGLCFADID